jgi:hypothetical protein
MIAARQRAMALERHFGRSSAPWMKKLLLDDLFLSESSFQRT